MLLLKDWLNTNVDYPNKEYDPWDKELSDFLHSVGAKFIVDPEESESSSFLSEVICTGSNGANWQVMFQNEYWCVSGMPETQVWLINETPGEDSYPLSIVALG